VIEDLELARARWLLLYALQCLLISRLFDAKRQEIDATGLCQWGYNDPEKI
jgi:hypothetical protein